VSAVKFSRDLAATAYAARARLKTFTFKDAGRVLESDLMPMCVPPWHVYFEYQNIHRLSKGCKSLMGERVGEAHSQGARVFRVIGHPRAEGAPALRRETGLQESVRRNPPWADIRGIVLWESNPILSRF